MYLLIIANAVGHEVQKALRPLDAPPGARANRRFEELLKRKIAEHSVQFIGEEAEFGSETIAQRLGLAWANIDMPETERAARGISAEQSRRAPIPRYLGDDARTQLTEEGYQRIVRDGWVELEPRLKSDEVREEYMLQRTMDEAGDAESILVICGIVHSAELADRFPDLPEIMFMVQVWESEGTK